MKPLVDNGITLLLSLIVAAISYFQPNEYTVDSMPKNVPIEKLSLFYDFIIIGSGSAGKN